MFRLVAHALAAAVVAVAIIGDTPASANTMHLSANGTGQVLLFPYYTARNGNASLLSLVNTTINAKAVRVNVREARGGFVVAQINVYLSAKDVWTAAIVSDSDGAQIVSNDTSCTAPLIANGLPFSAGAYSGDAASQISRERTREGYIEVIEMATIPNNTSTGRSVTHSAGVPACMRASPTITSVTYEPPAADLLAPTGGLMGSLSFVNVVKGMLASGVPAVIESFWLTGPNAAAPRAVPANSSAMDLTSEKNTSVAFAATSAAFVSGGTTNRYIRDTERFTARFATSIDALSALLMTSSVYTEYAFTQDQLINTLVVLTMPTKPYYIFSDPRSPSLGPFSSLWDKAFAHACENISVGAYTREEVTASTPDDFGTPPPRPPSAICSVVNPLVSLTNLVYFVYGLPKADDPTFFGSPIALGFMAIQNGGAAVPTPGKEGGWVEFGWTSSSAKLRPLEASVYRRNAAGNLLWQPVNITLTGLPVIGFTLSQAAYQSGSPQQNYADAVTLRSLRSVVVTTP